MKPAPCSCRGRMCRMVARCWYSPSYSAMVCSPGIPNTTSTPSAARASATACPPVTSDMRLPSREPQRSRHRQLEYLRLCEALRKEQHLEGLNVASVGIQTNYHLVIELLGLLLRIGIC